MNKRGFTLIELLVSFALITIVSLSLFKTVLTVQKKAQKDLSYNQYLSFAASFSSNLQKDFTGDKITSFSSCGTNCYDIVYETAGTKQIKIDRVNNTFSYGTIKEKLPNNYVFYGDLILSLNKIEGMAVDNYNSILTLTVPIKSNLSQSLSNITYTYQYDDREGEAPAAVFKTLTVNPNGGTYAGSASNTEYYLLPNASQDISTPIKANSVFNGWTSSCSPCLVDSTYTMGATDASLMANWLTYSSMYTYTGTSTVIDDGAGNWRIKFLTSGTFTPNISFVVDIWYLGGGAGGGNSNGYASGGGGGGGTTGQWSGTSLSAGTAYTITIGAGGTNQASGGVTSFTGGGYNGAVAGGTAITVGTEIKGTNGGSGGGTGDSGAGGSNGSGGASGSGGAGGSGQGTTTYEFSDNTLTLYAGGGGAGGGSNGSAGGAGGLGGGANGGAGNSNPGNWASANTGGGGGGAGRGTYSWSAGANGGYGGSGILVIRNHR